MESSLCPSANQPRISEKSLYLPKAQFTCLQNGHSNYPILPISMSCVKRKESSVRGVNKAWIKFPFLLLFKRWGKTFVCSADCTYQRGLWKFTSGVQKWLQISLDCYMECFSTWDFMARLTLWLWASHFCSLTSRFFICLTTCGWHPSWQAAVRPRAKVEKSPGMQKALTKGQVPFSWGPRWITLPEI